jgi:hypothetical protein
MSLLVAATDLIIALELMLGGTADNLYRHLSARGAGAPLGRSAPVAHPIAPATPNNHSESFFDLVKDFLATADATGCAVRIFVFCTTRPMKVGRIMRALPTEADQPRRTR